VTIFDPVRRRLVMRVVYDGPAFAGKTTNVQAICAAFPAERRTEVYTPGALRGRTMFFDWLEINLGRLGTLPVSCQVLSVPGQRARSYRRRPLVKCADALVFVADAQPTVLQENRRCLALMRRYLREREDWVPMVVQANKQDVTGALMPKELAAALRVPRLTPIVGAAAAQGVGVRECFNLAAKSAVRATQARISDDGIDALTGASTTADELLDAMLELEEDGRDAGEDEPTEDELDDIASA
jgi:signal recognition particle receptor subunit beta